MNVPAQERLVGHFFALARRKSVVDAEIREELRRPSPCSFVLQKLKRQRLWLKDRMWAIGGRSALARASA